MGVQTFLNKTLTSCLEQKKEGHMKTLGLFCLMLFFWTGVEAKCNCPKPPKPPKPKEDKIYIQPENIQILPNQIAVQIDEEILTPSALFSDTQGIYVLSSERRRRQGRCPDGYWECSECTGCTPWISPDCDWCGYY